MKTEDITLFHRIVETGSLVDAADILNLPKSTVSRRLHSLEEELSVKLFHRQSRAMTLTASGSHFYDKTLVMMADLTKTMTEITDTEAEIAGHLRILIFPVPELMDIVNGIFDFMDLHPKLSVELITTGEPMDMIRNNIDVAFLVEETFSETDMVAKPVISEALYFVASPGYLAKAGTPQTPSELADHNSILFRFPNGKTFSEVPLVNDVMQSVNGNLCTNSVQLCYEAALAGRGVAYMPIEFCKEDIEAGRLVTLFDDLEPYIGKVFLVYPSRRFISLASQRFLDYMFEQLANCEKVNCKSTVVKPWV